MTTIGLATERASVGIAKVYVDTWRSAYAGLLPNRVLLGMSYERQAREWSWVIKNRSEVQPVIVAAEPNRGIVGFTSFGLSRVTDRPPAGPFASDSEASTMHMRDPKKSYSLLIAKLVGENPQSYLLSF